MDNTPGNFFVLVQSVSQAMTCSDDKCHRTKRERRHADL